MQARATLDIEISTISYLRILLLVNESLSILSEEFRIICKVNSLRKE